MTKLNFFCDEACVEFLPFLKNKQNLSMAGRFLLFLPSINKIFRKVLNLFHYFVNQHKHYYYVSLFGKSTKWYCIFYK